MHLEAMIYIYITYIYIIIYITYIKFIYIYIYIYIYMIYFDDWFSNTKAFLCSIWNLRREKLCPSGSSDLVLHSSINRCVVNGRDAMAAHS